MYSRDELKALTDKVLEMAKADRHQPTASHGSPWLCIRKMLVGAACA